MSDGLFDDVPLMNRERDNSWEAFIKRKDVKAMFSEEGFGFPLNRGYYDLWCIAWAKAWDKGFMAGRDNPQLDAICQDLQEKTYTQAMRIAELEAKLAEKQTSVSEVEPVAWESVLGAVARGWCYEENANKTMDSELAVAIAKEVHALYTTTQQRTWVGLTDEQIEAKFKKCGGKWNGDQWVIEDADLHPFVRSIESPDLKTLQAVSDEYNAWIKHHAAGHSYDDFLAKREAAHGIKE